MTIMLIGEAWGKEEAYQQRPFVGASGRVLNGILSQVGIARNECYLTNVFNLKPEPNNDVKNLCGPKAEGIPWMPFLTKGKYVNAKYEPELLRLYREIDEVQPTVIVALGATPTWALLRSTGIRKLRGAPLMSDQPRLAAQRKVLPTYHPAAVMREWKLRPVVIMDMFKAKREAEFPEVRRPMREVWVEPTIEDLYKFERLYIENCSALSCDIETIGRMITCIGFAPRPDLSIVVPFYDTRKKDKNYWGSFEEEIWAWEWCRRQAARPVRKIGQNFMYDMNFTWTEMGIPWNMTQQDDTMLMHHALQPEMEKGLAFLGSIYTNEASWKFMRNTSTAKRED